MMDPALQEVILSAAPSEEVEAVALLRPGCDPPPPARAVARFGPVVTCRLPASAIVAVRNDPAVISLKASRVVGAADAFLESAADPNVGEWRRRPTSLRQRGSGVTLGVLDWGCDFAHPNFRRPDGSTRLLGLWDQRRPQRAHNRFGYGTVYGREVIDRALRSPDPYAALGYHPAEAASPGSLGTHGTHVMDIAAGSGSPEGIAPDTDLVFVHLAARNTPLIGGLGDSVRLLEGIAFVESMAGRAPWVCNCSLGRMGGDHTGQSIVERALDALVEENRGCCIVLSAGNYFAKRAHAEGWVRPNGEERLEWMIDAGDPTSNELEIWLSPRDRFAVELRSPDGVAFTAGLDSAVDILSGGNTVGRLYHRAVDPVADAHHVDCFLSRDAPSGRWEVVLHAIDVVDGRYHAWIERDAPRPRAQSSFPARMASPRCTIGSIAGGFRTICVGAVNPLTGQLGPFSSSGPLRSGRMKPDLVAPGVGILAAGSTARGAKPGSTGLVRMSGTSMAAPHAAGTVALMLGAAPRPLRIEETRAMLLGTCTPMDDADPLRVGAGMLDVSAAVRAAESVRPINTRVEEQEGEAMDDTMTGALASEVEAVLERGWTLTGEDAVLGELLGDDTGEGFSPDALFEGLMTGMPGPPDRVEVVAFPGQYLASELHPGDVLLRVARGERGLGHVAVLTDGELLAASTLNAIGGITEGSLAGRYARVIEGGAAPHSIDDLATRRITDRDGCLPYDQMIVRILPNGSSELDVEEVDLVDDEEIDDAESEATDAAASAALGRQLRARAPNGVAVAVYLAGDQLFKTEALAWAAREDALGMGPKATSIVAPQLRLGRPIPDTGDLAKLTSDLGLAMDEALAINPAGPVTGPFPQSPLAVIRALALFTHGSVTSVSICGGVDTTSVPPVVKDIAPRLTNDVRIMIYGCSVARGQGEKEDWYATTFTRGGADSLAGAVRDALLDEGKAKAEVWGHTEVGHAVNNFTLRRFAAGDNKGSDGVPFAGEIVFRTTERSAALQDVRAAVLALGVSIPDASAFDAAATKAIVSEMYKAYRDAQLTVTADKKELNKRTLQGENLAEMAPFYTEEVAVIIRDYWAATHWTEALRKKIADGLVKTLKLTKAPVTSPSPSPTPVPSRTPTPTLTPPREDVEDVPSAEWADDADTPDDDARATAALGQQILKRAPNGVAVAIYATDESRFRSDATKWAVREEALGIAEGRRKKLVAHQMSLGRPIPCNGKLQDIVNAVGRAIESAVSIDPITLSPLPIVFGPETRVRALALFTHGDIDWIGACQQIRNGDLGRVVKAMSPRLAPDIRVMIYGCQGARDADEPTPAWRRNSMRRGGSSSFCALFRDALLAEGKGNAEVWGHTESGSPTRNFSLRRFRAADGKGADGIPFAGEIVFGPPERKLARDQVEGNVIGLGYDISGATLAALHDRADTVVEAEMYKSYSEQTKVDIVNGKKVRSDRLTLRGASLGEMAPFYPDEVTAILREYWTDTFWTMEQQKNAARRVADRLHLKKSRAAQPSAAPTPVPVGP